MQIVRTGWPTEVASEGPADRSGRAPRSILHEPPASGEDRTFLVLPGGVCVPLDTPPHVAELRGEYYVLGSGCWTRCDSFEHATLRLSRLLQDFDPHRVVSDTLEIHD